MPGSPAAEAGIRGDDLVVFVGEQIVQSCKGLKEELAQLERDKGKMDDAVSHLRDAVTSEPGNVDARLELGRALYDKGDVGGAIAETEKILSADPKQVDALYNLGAIYANSGDAERARSYWKKAVEAGANADSGRKAQQGLSKLGGA